MSEENITKNPQSKMLYRSKTNSIISGVCGGIGEYFDIDPTLVRIAFVFFTVFGGSGIIIYILLWLILPASEEDLSTFEERKENAVKEMRETVRGNDNATTWVAFVLVGLGAYFLLKNLGLTINIFDLVSVGDIVPIALIIAGIYLFYKRR